MNTKKFVHLDSDGKAWGVVATEQLWANVYQLKYNKPEKRLDREVWAELFAQAKAAAIEFGAETIGCRIRKEYEPQVFRDVLTQIGLSKVAERVEYQCDVMSLPVEDGSPLRWKTVKELNWGTSRVAEFVSEITEGALDVNPNEKPEDFIKDWLYHDELTYGPDCIAIGFHREQPCALMVAQINKESGWSRLSYMGLVSEFRGRGLGKWVHRHGFTMMKSQGGKLYHGGTHADNLPMRKLFETHGCRVFCEMEEWNC